MNLADKGLNKQAQVLEEAQTKVRLAVRDGWLKRKSKGYINVTVQKIIRETLKQIKTSVLRDAAYRSLNAFAERQYNTYLLHFGLDPTLLLAIMHMINGKVSKAAQAKAAETIRAASNSGTLTFETDAKGIPLQVYSKDYFRDKVKPVFERLLQQKALDPDDVSGTNSLRNRAEMEVRYDAHLTQIADLKASGVKLVVSSVHADCSDRCYKWQGRVFSLDGTSGVTEDGKSYEPLEHATDIYYTTKAGKTYKNGLLGFNCRHYLMPYSPRMIIPHVSKETQQKEQRINARQRELERIVRRYEEEAIIYKNLNSELHSNAKRQAALCRREYIKFSHDNGRAYYPSRIKLL